MERRFPELKICLENPGICFNHPQEVISSDQFTSEEKRKILTQWALDVRERLVAEEENMPSSEQQDDDLGALLSSIHQTLDKLDK